MRGEICLLAIGIGEAVKRRDGSQKSAEGMGGHSTWLKASLASILAPYPPSYFSLLDAGLSEPTTAVQMNENSLFATRLLRKLAEKGVGVHG